MRTSQEKQIRLNLTEHAAIYNTGHVMFGKALNSKGLSSISAIHFKLNTGLEGQCREGRANPAGITENSVVSSKSRAVFRDGYAFIC